MVPSARRSAWIPDIQHEHRYLECGLYVSGEVFRWAHPDDSLAEMITGYPLFRGRDNADQLVQIMKIVGTPSEGTIAQIKMNSVSLSSPLESVADDI